MSLEEGTGPDVFDGHPFRANLHERHLEGLQYFQSSKSDSIVGVGYDGPYAREVLEALSVDDSFVTSSGDFVSYVATPPKKVGRNNVAVDEGL